MTIFGVVQSGPRFTLTRKSDLPVKEIFLDNDHRTSYFVEERTTGIFLSGLQLSASISLTPNGVPAASGSVTLSIGLTEDPPCSADYVGTFAGADLTAVLSYSLFASHSSSNDPVVYETITSGSQLRVVTPLFVRTVRFS